MTSGNRPLAGRTIAVTAERRGEEQAKLFRKRGADVLHAPTMHTVDLSDDAELRRCTERVVAAPPHWLVATTGFGMRLWFEAADSWGVGEDLVAALGRTRIVARGQKARSVCRQRSLEVEWTAPRESMPDVVGWMRGRLDIGAETVAVQLFDLHDHPSTVDLRAMAAAVIEIPVYRWLPPLDTGPALDLVRRIADRSVDAVTFTSQPAVRYLMQLAAGIDLDSAVVRAFNEGAVLPVCIGPVCAVAGAEAGIETMVWPEPFRLAPMVRLTEERLTQGTFG